MPFLAALLPDLIKSGLGLIANAALVKGKEFIKEKTGVDLAQTSLSADDKLKLLQFQATHEEELLRLQLEDNKLAFEETKAYLADVASARGSQQAIQTSADAPWYAKAIQPALAAFTICITLLLFAAFVYWSRDIPVLDPQGVPLVDANNRPLVQSGINSLQKDIVIYVLGVLSAAFSQILGFYFGSSQSSRDKSKTLDAALLQKSAKEAT